jgi:hypothetical protein
MSIRYIVVGLGNIGTRRRQVLGSHYVGGVDPLNREADWLAIDDVPPELRRCGAIGAQPGQN